MDTEGGAEITTVAEVVMGADFKTTTMAVEGSVQETSTMEVISPILLQIPRIPNLGQTLALAPLVRSATNQGTPPSTATNV